MELVFDHCGSGDSPGHQNRTLNGLGEADFWGPSMVKIYQFSMIDLRTTDKRKKTWPGLRKIRPLVPERGLY